jgi:hypothetical protein
MPGSVWVSQQAAAVWCTKLISIPARYLQALCLQFQLQPHFYACWGLCCCCVRAVCIHTKAMGFESVTRSSHLDATADVTLCCCWCADDHVYEARKEREAEEDEANRGAAAALSHNEFMYV